MDESIDILRAKVAAAQAVLQDKQAAPGQSRPKEMPEWSSPAMLTPGPQEPQGGASQRATKPKELPDAHAAFVNPHLAGGRAGQQARTVQGAADSGVRPAQPGVEETVSQGKALELPESMGQAIARTIAAQTMLRPVAPMTNIDLFTDMDPDDVSFDDMDLSNMGSGVPWHVEGNARELPESIGEAIDNLAPPSPPKPRVQMADGRSYDPDTGEIFEAPKQSGPPKPKSRLPGGGPPVFSAGQGDPAEEHERRATPDEMRLVKRKRMPDRFDPAEMYERRATADEVRLAKRKSPELPEPRDAEPSPFGSLGQTDWRSNWANPQMPSLFQEVVDAAFGQQPHKSSRQSSFQMPSLMETIFGGVGGSTGASGSAGSNDKSNDELIKAIKELTEEMRKTREAADRRPPQVGGATSTQSATTVGDKSTKKKHDGQPAAVSQGMMAVARMLARL